MFRRLSSPLDVTIRALRSTDSAVPRVQQLDNRCFQGGERSDIVAEIDRPFTYLWIAALSADPQCVVGYILTWHVADELHILNVATDPDHRGLGVGHALVAQAIAWAGQHHVQSVLLEVRRSNLAALRLYRSFGFFLRGLRKEYYGDGEDAVEMGLVLDPKTGDIVASRDEVRLEEVSWSNMTGVLHDK